MAFFLSLPDGQDFSVMTAVWRIGTAAKRHCSQFLSPPLGVSTALVAVDPIEIIQVIRVFHICFSKHTSTKDKVKYNKLVLEEIDLYISNEFKLLQRMG